MFGGHSVIRRTLEQVAAKDDSFTLLDVGAASGDTGRFIQTVYPGAAVVNADYNATNLEQASPPKVLANAFALPFADNSFDFVLSSLFLHHFTDEQAILLLRSFYRIARRALLLCDLERNIIPYWFLPLTQRLFGWKKITVRDGRISVRAAFRKHELLELCRSAGLERIQAAVYRPAFRIALVAKKTGCQADRLKLPE